jgi:mRNA interferase MazF
MSIGRGDIYRVDLEPTIGSEQQGAARPCVVLSISAFNKKLRTVVVVPLSSSARPLPPLVVSVPSAGIANSTALCGQVRTIDKRRLKNAMDKLSPADLEAVEKGVRQVLGL